MRNNIKALETKLRESIEALKPFDNSAYGVAEIRSNLSVSIRYLSKLEDEYVCQECGEDLKGTEYFNWYKAHVHEKCRTKLEERVGNTRGQ